MNKQQTAKKSKKKRSLIKENISLPTWVKRAKEIMRKKGIKQKELAKKMGISASAVTNYFKGKRLESIHTLDSLHTLQTMANILQVDAEYLIHGDNFEKKINGQLAHDDKNSIMLIRALTPNLAPVLDWHENWREIFMRINKEKTQREFYPSTNQLSKNGHFYYIKNDVMSSPNSSITFEKGDKIFCDPDISPVENDFIMVRNKSKQANEFFQLVNMGGELHLKPLNPQYPIQKYTKDWELIGVITEKVQSLKK